MFKFSQCRILPTIQWPHLLYRLHFPKQYFVSSLSSPKGRAELPGTLPSSRFSDHSVSNENKGNAVPLQAWTGPEGSRKLRLPDFVTTAQDGGRLSALRANRLYPQEIPLVLFSVRG